MAGILESLGMGLRSAGAVMDEGVYRGQKQEDMIRQQLQEKQRDMMAQQVIHAAQSGSMPPEAAEQVLARIGYKGMPVGPNAQAQQRQEELQRRDAIAKGFQSLAPEERANPLKIAQVFMDNGDHQTGARYIQTASEQQARREELVMRLDQQAREAQQRSEDKALDREAREQARRDSENLKLRLAEMADATKRDGLSLRAFISSQSRRGDGGDGQSKPPAGYRWAQGGTLEPIPGGPAAKEGSKLPAELQRMTIGLNALESGLKAYEDALKDFNPRGTDQLNMTKRAAISSLVADLRMQAKEAQALGALTGPDVAILDKALAEPASLKGAAYGRAGLREQVAQTRDAIKRRREGMASLTNKPSTGPASVDDLLKKYGQ